jgi:tetratricopeptide (TPR) repeat protein
MFIRWRLRTLSERSLTLLRNTISLRQSILALGVLATPVVASAQRAPANPPPRVMVATFCSSDKDVGQKAGDALRDRLTRDADARKLTVIPKSDINKTLEASGYSTTECLGPNDAKALATLLRADEYIDGVATKTPTGVKLDTRLILSRDQTVGQPLPSAEGAKPDQAASAIAKSYMAAREQLAAEKNCYAAFRDGKSAEAVQLARSGLAKYPNGTIAMVCMMNAYSSLKQTDSVLAVAERIAAVDPRNIQALRFQADLYGAQNNAEKRLEALTRLMAADPSNEKLRQDVIADLVRAGKAGLAVPIAEEALRANPGDPQTLKFLWLVYLAANQPEKALATGAEMIKADTTLADTTYFIRSYSAIAPTNATLANQIVSQGIAKFPTLASLLVLQANAQMKAGQNQQALATINRALAANNKVENGFQQKILILSALNMNDSALATIKVAQAAGVPGKAIAPFVLKMGSDAYKAGNVSKKREDLQKAVDLLTLADQLDASTDAKFLAGASSFLIGQSAVNEAQDTKSCTLARLAKDSFAKAQELVPAGLQSYAEPAKQLLTAIPQFTPAVDDQIRRFCK